MKLSAWPKTERDLHKIFWCLFSKQFPPLQQNALQTLATSMALNIILFHLISETTTLYLVLFPCAQFQKYLHAESHSEQETHFIFLFFQKS